MYNLDYQNKLISASEAVKLVKSGDRIQYSEFVMFPSTLDAALAERIHELKDLNLRGVCFTKVPKVVAADPNREHIVMEDYHFGTVSRRLCERDLCNYVPMTYHQGPRLIRKSIDIDVVFVLTGPMDHQGFFNLGLSNSVMPAVLSKAKKIIVEVNRKVPICLGGNQESIHISRVDHIVESDNDPIASLPPGSYSDTDCKIAHHVMQEIEDGACLQLGIGGLPNAVGSLIAESDLQDLGVHTEMFADSYVDLYQKGRITNNKKNIDKYKMCYTFAMGSQKLYDFMDNNPICASYPANYTNDPRIIALNDKVVAINNALEVDLYSQVYSESAGTKQISGTGGQLDFIFGAYNSHGGKGLICLSSTYKAADGSMQSRINPTLSPGSIVTLPRSLVHYVITEYGTAMLKGMSTWQRAEALIKIAHPSFRDSLIQSAEDMHLWTKTNKIS